MIEGICIILPVCWWLWDIVAYAEENISVCYFRDPHVMLQKYSIDYYFWAEIWTYFSTFFIFFPFQGVKQDRKGYFLHILLFWFHCWHNEDDINQKLNGKEKCMMTEVEEIQHLIIWYRSVAKMHFDLKFEEKSWDCSRFSDSCLTVSFCMFHLQCHDENHAGFSNEANEDGQYFQGLTAGAASRSCKRTPKNRK